MREKYSILVEFEEIANRRQIPISRSSRDARSAHSGHFLRSSLLISSSFRTVDRTLCQKADVTIAKGRKKQARDYLVDALMALRHDATPDPQQASKIKEIERRIAALDAS
jgi:hypothetical protein